MNSVSITGYGDDLTVNGVRIGDLTPAEHESIEKDMGGQNYSPLEDVVVSKVKDSSTLVARRPHPDDIKRYIETELIDGLCCYSAVNQGQLNKTIVNSVIEHLDKEKLPTVPRSIRHKYMSAFLLAVTGITGMDKVVPKVAGVESWELSLKNFANCFLVSLSKIPSTVIEYPVSYNSCCNFCTSIPFAGNVPIKKSNDPKISCFKISIPRLKSEYNIILISNYNNH